ncbi:MAG: tetratricopeptide repeat protein, partial [Mucilaginibacter sp.]
NQQPAVNPPPTNQQAVNNPVVNPAPSNQQAANNPPVTNQAVNPPPSNQQAAINQPATNPAVNNVPVKAPSIFSMRDSTNYYFAVNVSNGTANLASTRFGFGQFNRANLTNSTITHQLLSVGDNDQLIYIGRFYNLGAVKDYARAIVPLLPDIMKVPKNEYTFFIITGENLLKLKDKSTLDTYMDFYQNNY